MPMNCWRRTPMAGCCGRSSNLRHRCKDSDDTLTARFGRHDLFSWCVGVHLELEGAFIIACDFGPKCCASHVFEEEKATSYSLFDAPWFKLTAVFE